MKGKCHILILAAGQSSRMGQCKMTMKVGEKSLLGNTIASALEITDNVLVVVGGYKEEVVRIVESYSVKWIYNEAYKNGISTSIKKGIDTLVLDDNADRIILTVADQPYISSGVFSQLIEKSEHSPSRIIVSEYANTFGVPCLFPAIHYSLFETLEGDQGAKKILLKNEHLIERIPFAKGHLDIDTLEEFNSLL